MFSLTFLSVHSTNKADDDRRDLTGVDGLALIPEKQGEIELLNSVFTAGSLLVMWIIKSFERDAPFCVSGSINLQLNCGRFHNLSKKPD